MSDDRGTPAFGPPPVTPPAPIGFTGEPAGFDAPMSDRASDESGSSGSSGEARPRSTRPFVIVAIVVAALAVAGGVFAVTRSSDGESGSGADGSTLVRFDLEDEVIDVLDLDGEVQRTIEVDGTSSAQFVPALAGRVVFASEDEGSVTIVSLDDGEIDTYEVPGGPDSGLVLNRAISSTDERLLFDDRSGGDAVYLDIESGEFGSVSDLLSSDEEPRLILGSRTTSAWVYVDLNSSAGESVVVPSASDEAPWVVPGAVTDLDGRRSLVVRRDGEAMSVSIFDGEDEVVTVDADDPVRGGMLTGDDTALVVGIDGRLSSMSDGALDDRDRLDIDVQYFRSLGSDRLFVGGDDGQQSFILNGSGEVVVEYDAVDDRTMLVYAGPVRPDARCVVVQPGFDVRFDEGDVFLVDVVSGETVTELQSTGTLLDTSDGCSVTTAIDETADVVLDGVPREFDGFIAVGAVSADLRSVVVRGEGRDSFVLIDVESGDETILDVGFYAFVRD